MTKMRIALGLLLCCSAHAAEVVFPIATDVSIDSLTSNTGKNYGAATTVKVLASSNGSVCRALFQLPAEIGLYPTNQIAAATVFFYVWQDNTSDRNITLFPLTRSFVEGTGNGTMPPDGATWQTYDGLNAWTEAGGDFNTNHPVIGIKGPIVDEVNHGRYFSWDITPLLTNEQARTELMSCGALLRIDEVPVPPSGMPRAPFTSSDGAVNERPFMQLLVIARTSTVDSVSMTEESVILNITNCTPYVTNRIERSLDLQQADGWTLVTNLVTSGSETHWTESVHSDWTNAFYRVRNDE